MAGTETVSTGEYADVYVVEEGRWVMAECLFAPGWSITRPLDDARVTLPEVPAQASADTSSTDAEVAR